ncbi:hypothetical protein HNR54_000983 [Methanothermobacter sp. DSM 3267]
MSEGRAALVRKVVEVGLIQMSEGTAYVMNGWT